MRSFLLSITLLSQLAFAENILDRTGQSLKAFFKSLESADDPQTQIFDGLVLGSMANYLTIAEFTHLMA